MYSELLIISTTLSWPVPFGIKYLIAYNRILLWNETNAIIVILKVFDRKKKSFLVRPSGIFKTMSGDAC